MLISKEALEKIKKIIYNNYNALLTNTIGSDLIPPEELEILKESGFDVENRDSLLSLIYFNNVLNDLTSTTGPLNISQMKNQQAGKPQGPTFKAAEEHLNENFAQNVRKLRTSMITSVEGIIRNYNFAFRNKILGDPDRPEDLENLVKQSTVSKLKQILRDTSKDGDRDWQRVAITETANALGMGSVDRVINQNRDADLEEIYVYRIPVNDAALCKYCRKFYLDPDQTPAVYKMSTLLGNGTNYGKKPAEWRAVAGATHPNDREAGILELRRGWKVGSEGRLEFIGEDVWDDYIKTKVRD